MILKNELLNPSVKERAKFIISEQQILNRIIQEDDNVIRSYELDENEKAQKKREELNALTCTKREFVLALQELGITYSEVKELIAGSEAAQLEWDLCSVLLRGNTMLNSLASSFGLTEEQLDNIFINLNTNEE